MGASGLVWREGDVVSMTSFVRGSTMHESTRAGGVRGIGPSALRVVVALALAACGGGTNGAPAESGPGGGSSVATGIGGATGASAAMSSGVATGVGEAPGTGVMLVGTGGGATSAAAGIGATSADGGTAGVGGRDGVSDAGDSGGADGWMPIFNGVDLSGWSPKITHYPYGDNYANTFRVVNGVLTVSYADYDETGFGGDTGKFGLLYYTTPLRHYRVRVEYRFTSPQAPNPCGWCLRNSGLMVMGENPANVGLDTDFPRIFEIQLVAAENTGNTTIGNLCPLGGSSVLVRGTRVTFCGGSTSGPVANDPLFANDAWVTVEAEILGNSGENRVWFAGIDDPVLIFTDPVTNGASVDGGYLALQAEGHPIEFRKVEILILP
jgi:hypothetical protein